MADNNGGDGHDEDKSLYGQYQAELYMKGVLLGQPPQITTNPSLLEAQARKAMAPGPFNYIYGGAGEGATMDANRLAFRQWKLIPRFLRPTLPRDLSVELFGRKYPTPVIMAPIGVTGAYHPDGEVGVATACADLGVPYTLSTVSTTTIEQVAHAFPSHPATAPSNSPRWFQLYWPISNALTASLLHRAEASGFSVLLVTLDTFTVSWRPYDLDGAYLPMIHGEGLQNAFSDPVFRRQFAEVSDDDNATPEAEPLAASRAFLSDAFSGHSHTWEDLKFLRQHWGGPIVLKGILSVEDARLALHHGMDGIIVSNHGGRQLDGAVPSLEMLPEIVDAVGDQMTVLFDSGIRTGADIMKALCLGAKAVLVGRPVMYGLGIGGMEGARHILAGLLADLDQSMGLASVKRIGELTRDRLRRVVYGGDIKASL